MILLNQGNESRTHRECYKSGNYFIDVTIVNGKPVDFDFTNDCPLDLDIYFVNDSDKEPDASCFLISNRDTVEISELDEYIESLNEAKMVINEITDYFFMED